MDGTITADMLPRMPLLNSVVNESARLHPAATVVCRQATAPLRVGEYSIPAGALVMICPGVAHRLPTAFPNPDAFVANRFLYGRANASDCITFGSGPHRCLGYDFALAEMMIVIATLISRYDLALATPNPAPNYDMSVTRPAPPCIISYRRRHSSGLAWPAERLTVAE